ncbi:hypothetical protein NEOKW01_1047 [Nematocida sp. AWRm80]|nr:hypothetical protein NEOKW01_1047 [Nematocida sp. AWRm80]
MKIKIVIVIVSIFLRRISSTIEELSVDDIENTVEYIGNTLNRASLDTDSPSEIEFLKRKRSISIESIEIPEVSTDIITDIIPNPIRSRSNMTIYMPNTLLENISLLYNTNKDIQSKSSEESDTTISDLSIYTETEQSSTDRESSNEEDNEEDILEKVDIKQVITSIYDNAKLTKETFNRTTILLYEIIRRRNTLLRRYNNRMNSWRNTKPSIYKQPKEPNTLEYLGLAEERKYISFYSLDSNLQCPSTVFTSVNCSNVIFNPIDDLIQPEYKLQFLYPMIRIEYEVFNREDSQRDNYNVNSLFKEYLSSNTQVDKLILMSNYIQDPNTEVNILNDHEKALYTIYKLCIKGIVSLEEDLNLYVYHSNLLIDLINNKDTNSTVDDSKDSKDMKKKYIKIIPTIKSIKKSISDLILVQRLTETMILCNQIELIISKVIDNPIQTGPMFGLWMNLNDTETLVGMIKTQLNYDPIYYTEEDIPTVLDQIASTSPLELKKYKAIRAIEEKKRIRKDKRRKEEEREEEGERKGKSKCKKGRERKKRRNEKKKEEERERRGYKNKLI